MSLGHGAAGYTMKEKLEAASQAGFEGIEVSRIEGIAEILSLNSDPRSSTWISRTWRSECRIPKACETE